MEKIERSYNPAYSYENMELWLDDTWKDAENEAAPLFHFLARLLAKEQSTDVYEGRNDEVRDTVNHAAYFPDVVDAWKKRGMHFSSYGMMGELMAPDVVERQELYNPKVLFIPFVRRDTPHEAMNLLANYEAVLEAAAKGNILVQFTDCAVSCGGAMVEKIIETQGTFRIAYARLYLDITALSEAGLSLSDVPGLDEMQWITEELCGRKVVDVSKKLVTRVAHQYSIAQIYKKVVPEWEFDRHIKSMAGKRQARSMRLEKDFSGPHDPGMARFWKEKGIRYEDHGADRDWYVTLRPVAKW